MEKRNQVKKRRKKRLTQLFREPPAATNCGWTAIVFRSPPVLSEAVCHVPGHGQTPRRVASRCPSPPRSEAAIWRCRAEGSQSTGDPASDVAQDRPNSHREGIPGIPTHGNNSPCPKRRCRAPSANKAAS